ncbi:MAG TPA: amidohydrolase [Candidatus Binatia bacterium]
MSAAQADLLLTGGWVVTGDAAGTVISDGAVAVKGNRIAAVGPAARLAGQVSAGRTIDCAGKAIMPGLIDCHVHTCQQLARGLADDIPVREWLEKIVAFESAMDEEDVRWSARLACLEMIKSGTTSFIEACANPFHVDAVGNCLEESGLRGVLTRSCMEIPESDWKTPDAFVMSAEENFTGTARMIERWNGAAGGRIQAWVGWRQQWNLSDELLVKIVRLAQEKDVGLHGHLATRRFGQIEHLDRLGVLWPDMVFAHAIRFTGREIDLIRHYDLKINHNPGASMHGAYGSAVAGQFPELLERGVHVCLGCDGAANNNTLDMFTEMRLASTLHKETRQNAYMISPRQSLAMATRHGAAALRRGDRLGVLAEGRLADIVTVDLAKPHLQPVHDVVSNLVYCANGGDVSMTIVDGRILMEDRKVLSLDEKQTMEQAGRRAQAIKRRCRQWISRGE